MNENDLIGIERQPCARNISGARRSRSSWGSRRTLWVNAMRMGVTPPHLGLVVTAGSLDAYSQRGGTFNDRGVFLLHPAAMNIERGKSATITWKLFWHKGWDDFP